MRGFSRTLRALQQDGVGSTALVLGLAVAVLGGWAGWLALARVSLYEVSETARLEVERVYPVSSPVTGRVVAANLVLSREVREGEVLVEVEADRERLEMAEEHARMAALSTQLQALAREIEAEQVVLKQARRAGTAAVSEAQKKQAGAQAAVRQAQEHVDWTRQLVERHLVPRADLSRALFETEMRRADAEAAAFGVERMSSERLGDAEKREARIAELSRARATLEGQRTTLQSVAARREREAERRRIRAPVGGRLGDVVPMQIGALVREGDRLASIVPEGRVHVVADFPPTALGRISAGQTARLRLEGFPWLQYGRLPAIVTRIASEARERRIRVELALEPVSDLPVSVQHGLPATVEVEVERVAPAILLLRGAGYLLAPTGSPPSPPR